MTDKTATGSHYCLYGSCIIANDETLRDFVKSVFANVPRDGISAEQNSEEYKDCFLEFVNTIIEDDVSRTDINYPLLMHKYRSKLGQYLYDFENNGYDLGQLFSTFSFFDEKAAKTSLEALAETYAAIHYSELLSELS